jgi:hypothetical protein
MQFSYDVTIPASTSENTPYEYKVRLDTGTLTGFKIRFRAGCHNRVFVAVFDGLNQIIPAHETKALYADNFTFEIPLQYAISYKPYDLIVKGWSPSTRYDHTISIWLDLIESAQEKQQGPLSNLLHLFGG